MISTNPAHNDPIYKYTMKLAEEQAQWIDTTVSLNIPEWKRDILKQFPRRWLAILLRVNIEIIHETLIAHFGKRIIIKNNGKVIGERMFKYE